MGPTITRPAAPRRPRTPSEGQRTGSATDEPWRPLLHERGAAFLVVRAVEAGLADLPRSPPCRAALSSFSISLIVSFDAATDSGALSAIVRAIPSTASFSSSSGRIWLIRPIRSASRRVDPLARCTGSSARAPVRPGRSAASPSPPHRRSTAAPPGCRTGCPAWRSADRSPSRSPARRPCRSREFCAMIGFGKLCNLSRPIPVSRSYSFCASALWRFFSNWLISAPETNALSPAPVSTTTLIVSSACELVQDLAQPDPHLHGHGVALFRLVERDQPDAVILRRQHLAAGVSGSVSARSRQHSDHSLLAHRRRSRHRCSRPTS